MGSLNQEKPAPWKYVYLGWCRTDAWLKENGPKEMIYNRLQRELMQGGYSAAMVVMYDHFKWTQTQENPLTTSGQHPIPAPGIHIQTITYCSLTPFFLPHY